MRAEAGLTGRELAERLSCTQSKVSKLESGKQTPTPADLDAWAVAVEQPDAAAELKGRLRGLEPRYRSWRRQLAGGHRVRQEVSVSEESKSTVIRAFEPSVIPSMLQTPDYARSILTNVSDLHGTANDIDDGVRARMKRQALLYEPGRQFLILVWEPALYVRYGAAEVMNGQLDRLSSLIGLDTVRLGIVPFGAALKVTPKQGFWIFDERLVIAETVSAEMWLDDAADIDPGPELHRQRHLQVRCRLGQQRPTRRHRPPGDETAGPPGGRVIELGHHYHPLSHRPSTVRTASCRSRASCSNPERTPAPSSLRTMRRPSPAKTRSATRALTSWYRLCIGVSPNQHGGAAAAFTPGSRALPPASKPVRAPACATPVKKSSPKVIDQTRSHAASAATRPRYWGSSRLLGGLRFALWEAAFRLMHGQRRWRPGHAQRFRPSGSRDGRPTPSPRPGDTVEPTT
ncbi:transcriptional regulator with XRE-family HTH domain [Streptacidiphilus sp. BW17]